MSDPLTDYLLSKDQRHAKVSTETLELMGKQAAKMYLDEGKSLDVSICKLAAAYPEFNAEQAKRVCEFANTEVYLSIHEKNKTAGVKTSAPHFPLADPAVVIARMTKTAAPSIEAPADSSYSVAPKARSKVASARFENALQESFLGKNGVEKKASPERSETGNFELVRLKDQLQGMKEHLASANQTLAIKLADAETEYYGSVREHLLSGGSLADVLIAARSTGADDRQVAATMQPFIADLLKEKVASADSLRTQAKGIDKVAHRVVNHEHPLVSLFGAVADLQKEASVVEESLRQVDGDLAEVNKAIREVVGARATR